jgi:hypothetical protein
MGISSKSRMIDFCLTHYPGIAAGMFETSTTNFPETGKIVKFGRWK